MSNRDWLILNAAPGVGPTQADALIARFGDISAALRASRRELASAGLADPAVDALRRPDDDGLARSDAWLAGAGCRLVTWADPEYPALLRDISDPPLVLFLRGDPYTLQLPQLSIVGSRSATAGGRETARQFATHLGRAGFCITSGLARGIDAAAHRGALQAGACTIAVGATGPDIVYPAAHGALADEIAEQGAVVTEYPPGTGPRPFQFPRRNRLISGLSVGTLVVEASLRSGALITARLAAEQGREVFAIPGSIHNPTARGCHRLIRDGAKLVETADDIIAEIPGLLARVAEDVPRVSALPKDVNDVLDAEYARLVEAMGWDPVSVDQLVTRTGLTAAEVSSMLLILELAGRVDSLAGGRYQQREAGRSP